MIKASLFNRLSRARDYDPVIGRWLQRDPIKFEGGTTNLYEYCGNDSVNCIDPTGTQVTLPIPLPNPIVVAPIIGACLIEAAKDRANMCDAQAEKDESKCRSLKSSASRAICWATANVRYGECIKNGYPITPLYTFE
jgi:uncharacterized protein RhaS with RHS repeats